MNLPVYVHKVWRFVHNSIIDPVIVDGLRCQIVVVTTMQTVGDIFCGKPQLQIKQKLLFML